MDTLNSWEGEGVETPNFGFFEWGIKIHVFEPPEIEFEGIFRINPMEGEGEGVETQNFGIFRVGHLNICF